MTIPTMTNCAHRGEGWCLACVGRLGAENDRLREALRAAADCLLDIEQVGHNPADLASDLAHSRVPEPDRLWALVGRLAGAANDGHYAARAALGLPLFGGWERP
jgi:hypothetical protein